MKQLFLLAFIFSSQLFSQQQQSLALQNARHSETWVRNGIMYEIYPRAFSKEGNFAGIEKRLPELQQLGVTILWLMPIHPVGVEKRKGSLGSSYSIQDYYGINPEYGTLADFKKLVKRAHELKFKIVIDLVANHTSWDSKMIHEHPEWFSTDSIGKIISPVPDWSDVADLNYSNKDLRTYMIAMMKYWVRDIGIDGFRCDVAEMVPTDFWNDARAALDSIKPVMMLAEGQYPEQHLKAFDLSYSWNLYSILAPLMKGEKNVFELDSLLNKENATFPNGSLRLRFSSNHDENAWDAPDVEKFGADGAKLAAVVVNTLPGVPLLYNGQEVANAAKLGLFEKFDIDWKAKNDFRNFYTKLFDLRKKYRALSVGELIRFHSTNGDRVFAFLRQAGKERLLVVYNFSDKEIETDIDLSSITKAIKVTDVLTKTWMTLHETKEPRVLSLTLPQFGFNIFSIE